MYIQKHLHHIGKFESLRFPACGTAEETVHHFLLMFPEFTAQRGVMERALQRATKSISTLLSNPKAFPHLFRFVNDTWHLHSIFGELRPE